MLKFKHSIILSKIQKFVIKNFLQSHAPSQTSLRFD